MTIVVGVRFKDSGKTYHFDPREVPVVVGDWVIVETVRGPELARIASPPAPVPPDQIVGDLKPVLRRANQRDLDNLAHYQQYLDEALAICAEKVAQHKLPMVLIKAEYNFDGSRLTFFFTAEKRVDFRELVRDLARTFHTRIELRQVGPRDEAKLLGGIGPCGRLLCCATFLPDFARVSIKMAKDQDLPLNPVKISGVCGRLLCCLSYEHEQYLQIKAELPPRGAWVRTPEGPGEVIAVNVVRETVTVELISGNTIDCTADQIAEVTERVAAEARARNAEGITPVARGDISAIDYDADPDLALLDRLQDQPDARPPTSRSNKLEAALMPAAGRRELRPTGSAQPALSQTERQAELGQSDSSEPRPTNRPQPGRSQVRGPKPPERDMRPPLDDAAADRQPAPRDVQPNAETHRRAPRRRRRRGGESK